MNDVHKTIPSQSSFLIVCYDTDANIFSYDRSITDPPNSGKFATTATVCWCVEFRLWTSMLWPHNSSPLASELAATPSPRTWCCHLSLQPARWMTGLASKHKRRTGKRRRSPDLIWGLWCWICRTTPAWEKLCGRWTPEPVDEDNSCDLRVTFQSFTVQKIMIQKQTLTSTNFLCRWQWKENNG